MRRGAVQALVRAAYQSTVAKQDSEHRPPAAFAQAWHDHLADLLNLAQPELPGWGHITIAGLDIDLAWSLYQLASRARLAAVEHARAAPSRHVQRGQHVPTFEFAIVSDGESFGNVTYGICQACRTGLLYKIEYVPDWQFCGFGRLALSQLEDRHPSVTWHTTGQLQHARGFYDRYRQDSSSPWTARQHPARISTNSKGEDVTETIRPRNGNAVSLRPCPSWCTLGQHFTEDHPVDTDDGFHHCGPEIAVPTSDRMFLDSPKLVVKVILKAWTHPLDAEPGPGLIELQLAEGERNTDMRAERLADWQARAVSAALLESADTAEHITADPPR